MDIDRNGGLGISPDPHPWRKGKLRMLGSLLMPMMAIKEMRRRVSQVSYLKGPGKMPPTAYRTLFCCCNRRLLVLDSQVQHLLWKSVLG